MTAETSGPVAVSGQRRAEITRIAAHLLPEPERQHAEMVTKRAEPLLKWAGEARDEDDLWARMEALRQQDVNTPRLLRRVSGAVGLVEMPAVTTDEFVAGTAVLYGFIAGVE